jgi:myosin-1
LILQKAFRRFNAANYYLKLKTEASDLTFERKERRSNSLNRKFYGDYIGLDKPVYLAVRALLPKKENVEFAQTCAKFDRQFKRQKRDLVLTNKALYIIGREEMNKKDKLISKIVPSTKQTDRKIVEVVKRRLEYGDVNKIVLSHLADNFLVLFPNNDFGSLLEVEFKTEFLTSFSKKFKESTGRQLKIEFSDS